MIKKWTKTITGLTIHRSCQKTTKNEKYQYFIIPCANSPPQKREKGPSRSPPNILLEPLRTVRDAILTPRDPSGAPRASQGPPWDPPRKPLEPPPGLPRTSHKPFITWNYQFSLISAEASMASGRVDAPLIWHQTLLSSKSSNPGEGLPSPYPSHAEIFPLVSSQVTPYHSISNHSKPFQILTNLFKSFHIRGSLFNLFKYLSSFWSCRISFGVLL